MLVGDPSNTDLPPACFEERNIALGLAYVDHEDSASALGGVDAEDEAGLCAGAFEAHVALEALADFSDFLVGGIGCQRHLVGPR